MAATERAHAIARRFGARAARYDEHALLQRVCAQGLAGRIAARGGLPGQGRIVEIGCGTGLLSELLAPSTNDYLATDLAPAMVERCRQRLGHLPQVRFKVLNGEGVQLSPAPSAIVTNLTAQWFTDPAAGLAALAMQTPYLAFSVPLAGSFSEWEQAFANLGRTSGLHPMPQAAELRRTLSHLPGRIAALDTEAHVLRYPDARAFAESFRAIGADTPRPGYRPAPIRKVLERFRQGIEATAIVLYGIITTERA